MKPTGGFALAAAMMVLALLSVLAIAATQSTTLETQISAHDRDARSALYVAESALEEARYYVARGWGKIEAYSSGRVRVSTLTPGPADFWHHNRYVGFTLTDAMGASFAIQDHTDVANPVITLTSGDPAPGRFVVYRTIPNPADVAVTWDAASSELRVQSATWAAGTESHRWNGWVLWNASGDGFTVLESGTTAAPDTVWLTFSGDPGAGPYRLSYNPWVAALAAGQTPPGDDDGTTTAWDRSFVDTSGNPAGNAEVEATGLAIPGRYQMTSTGHLHNGHRAVSLTVTRAGLPEQRVGDWRVEGEL
jgi:type II secretory pathway pseudopilin PulG